MQANAEKQRRYRERQREQGNKQIRGYLTPDAVKCYADIADKTDWTDNEILNNALRITYAAYKCGQIKLLNEWLKNNDR